MKPKLLSKSSSGECLQSDIHLQLIARTGYCCTRIKILENRVFNRRNSLKELLNNKDFLESNLVLSTLYRFF